MLRAMGKSVPGSLLLVGFAYSAGPMQSVTSQTKWPTNGFVEVPKRLSTNLIHSLVEIK
jgi:hypothetical protein